ncbi:MAG: 2-oxoacid:ferredoxin oxidoreductase subunit beta [Prevotellaceae bacterium]|jgi:2-oxoglutarate ferredoxin oxidoreductase subunit beta|nr:2-oxoacid:ferredoxin oxidoreductase subunit beta [Prevotellaceae bacterium]
MELINKDFKSNQSVKWCPGCGDHALIATLQKSMAEIGIAPHNVAVVSGIGCSSRLPYYLSTYGFHSIHGRGAAIASGVKTANPNISVWQATGDGDCLAIGGNHFIHSVRRNININVLLFNNRIYGLTKGQYSPTSPKGFVSKSSPYGTVEKAFVPAELTFGAGGTFFARTLDVDAETARMVLLAAHRHKGTSVVECLVNCVIFNHGTHAEISSKEARAEKTVVLEHGKPMIFGAERNKGLVLDGWNLKVVTIGENGITESDILIHDAKEQDYALHLKLAQMKSPEMPVAMGVIRDVAEDTYETELEKQIETVKSTSKVKNFDELLGTLEQWEI